MKFKDYKEATEFVKALARIKTVGSRQFIGLKLDSVPAWAPNQAGAKVEHKLDGTECEAVYLSYMEATDKQKEQALPAKLAGCKLERISGRLVDVRTCKDGTTQLLLTNGLRDGEGKVAFRGPNIDKGILCAISFDEGLGENVDDIIARVPDEMIAKLKAEKARLAGKKKPKAEVAEALTELDTELKPEPVKVEVKVTVEVTAPEVPALRVKRPSSIEVPSIDKPEEKKLKLK